MEMKRCKQCGILKEASEFRQYTYSKTNDTQGRLSTCRSCESINTVYKRALDVVTAYKTRQAAGGEGGRVVKDALGRDVVLSDLRPMPEEEAAMQTVAKYDELFAMLREKGYKVPEFGSRTKKAQTKSDEQVDALLAFYGGLKSNKMPLSQVSMTDTPPLDIPDDLSYWLDTSQADWEAANLSPEYLQETVYESLKAKYRPQVGFDKEKGLPVYDDTFKSVLNDILKKFDDYEDAVAESSLDSDADYVEVTPDA